MNRRSERGWKWSWLNGPSIHDGKWISVNWKVVVFTNTLKKPLESVAVNWFLKVYWLLPLSTVDSFGKHRRLFCWAPCILGPFNQLDFPKESFPYFNGLFFSSSTTNCRQLDRSRPESTDTYHKTLLIFADKTVMPEMPNSSVLSGPAKIYVCTIGERASMRRGLSLDRHPCKKGNYSGIYSTCHFQPYLKIYWPDYSWQNHLRKSKKVGATLHAICGCLACQIERTCLKLVINSGLG